MNYLQNGNVMQATVFPTPRRLLLLCPAPLQSLCATADGLEINRELLEVQSRLAELNPEWEREATVLAGFE